MAVGSMTNDPRAWTHLDCRARASVAILVLMAIMITAQIGWPTGSTYPLYQSLALAGSLGLPLMVFWTCRRVHPNPTSPGDAAVRRDWLPYDAILGATLCVLALWNLGFSVDYAVYADGAWRSHAGILMVGLGVFYPLILIFLSFHRLADRLAARIKFLWVAVTAQFLLTLGVLQGSHADVFFVGTVGGGVVGVARLFHHRRERSRSVARSVRLRSPAGATKVLLGGAWLVTASSTVLMYAVWRDLSFGILVSAASFGFMWLSLYFVFAWADRETYSRGHEGHHADR